MSRFTPVETWTRETYKARERWLWVARLSEAAIYSLSRYLSNVGAENARSGLLAAYGEHVYVELHAEVQALNRTLEVPT